MKTQNIGRVIAFISLPLLWGISGCAIGVIGVGAGVGAITYINGQLQKTYEAGYQESVQVSMEILDLLKIQVTDKVAGELKTTIKAERPDGTPVTLYVERIEEGLTRVGVRTGTVGIGIRNKQASEQIQDFIGRDLMWKSGTHYVLIEPEKKKTPPQSSSRPVDEIKSAKKPEPKSIQKTSPAPEEKKLGNKAQIKTGDTQDAEEKQSGDYEQIKTGNTQDAAAENQDFLIYFEENSNTFPRSEVEKLNRATEIIRTYPEAAVILKGYPDSSGNLEYDMMISEYRAIAVKLYLISKGIDQDQISIIAHQAAADVPPEELKMLFRSVKIEVNKIHSTE
jgi:outer membrane protein OmpA-like peptidoglycan-associated protein